MASFQDETRESKGPAASGYNLESPSCTTHDLLGKWIKESEICENMGLQTAMKIEFLSDKEIGIAEHDSAQVKVFSHTGQFKYNIEVEVDSTDESYPRSLVTNKCGLIFVTDHSPFIKIFDMASKLMTKVRAIPPGHSTS